MAERLENQTATAGKNDRSSKADPKRIAHQQKRLSELARSILQTIVDQLNGTMVRIR